MGEMAWVFSAGGGDVLGAEPLANAGSGKRHTANNNAGKINDIRFFNIGTPFLFNYSTCEETRQHAGFLTG